MKPYSTSAGQYRPPDIVPLTNIREIFQDGALHGELVEIGVEK